MFATLATTTQQTGFSLGNVLAFVIFVAGFWLFQRWLRDRVSPRRRARWAEDERLEQERLGRLDGAPSEPGGPADEPRGNERP